MKKIFLLLIIVLFNYSAYSQLNIGIGCAIVDNLRTNNITDISGSSLKLWSEYKLIDSVLNLHAVYENQSLLNRTLPINPIQQYKTKNDMFAIGTKVYPFKESGFYLLPKIGIIIPDSDNQIFGGFYTGIDLYKFEIASGNFYFGYFSPEFKTSIFEIGFGASFILF